MYITLIFGLLAVVGMVAILTLPSPADTARSSTLNAPVEITSIGSGNWADPTVWSSGAAPQAGEKVIISAGHAVLFEGSAIVAGLEISGTLDFSRTANTSLESSGNIVVHSGGELLVGLPDDPVGGGVKAEIIFDVDTNGDFVGGDGFAETDTGLWVMPGGRWESHGSPIVVPWTDLANDALSGSTILFAEGDLQDWPAGSTVLVTSTGRSIDPFASDGGRTDFFTEDEERVLVAATPLGDGTTEIRLNAPLSYDHSGSGDAKGEIALLSRNVIVKSKSDALAHTIYMGDSSGSPTYTLFTKLGPTGVLSRYPVHFDQMGASSIGKVVRGNVVWDARNHFFVVHNSMGVEISDNIGYRTYDVGYWLQTTDTTISPKSYDNTFIHNLAVKISLKDSRGARLAAFYSQRENHFIDNTAVSVAGTHESSGFHWPEADIQSAGHTFLLNESHSNLNQGLHGWQNSGNFHIVQFSAWRNDDAGVRWGAYGNRVQFHGLTSFGNANANFNTRNNRPFIQDSHLYGEADYPTEDGLFVNFYTLPPTADNPGRTFRSVFENHYGFDINHLDKNECSNTGCIPTFNAIVDTELLSARNIRFGSAWENETTFFDVQNWAGTEPGFPNDFRITRPDQPQPSVDAYYSDSFDAWIDPSSPVPTTWAAPPTINWTATPADLALPQLTFAASAAGFTGGIGDIEFFADEFEQGAPWTAEYFDNTSLSGAPVIVTEKPTLEFTWGVDSANPSVTLQPTLDMSPYAPITTNGLWSVRFSRTIEIDADGEHDIYYKANDGIRIYVDGVLLVDKWTIQSSAGTNEGNHRVNLAAGPHDVVVEFFAESDDRAHLTVNLSKVLSGSSTTGSFTLDTTQFKNRRQIHVYARAHDPITSYFAYAPAITFDNPSYVPPAVASGGPDALAAELATIVVSPAEIVVGPSSSFQFTATGFDQFGQEVALTPIWSKHGIAQMDTNSGVLSLQWRDNIQVTVYADMNGVRGSAQVTVKSPVSPLPDPEAGDSVGAEFVWVDDAAPEGAYQSGVWEWTSSDPQPYSGYLAHRSGTGLAEHQHLFDRPYERVFIQDDDILVTYVYLDPDDPPSEVMLQWSDGSWNHRAYWGENRIPWGDEGSEQRQFMGPLPAVGEWVRLEVPATLVGMQRTNLQGITYTLFGGRAWWDYSAVLTPGVPESVTWAVPPVPPAPAPTPTPAPTATPAPPPPPSGGNAAPPPPPPPPPAAPSGPIAPEAPRSVSAAAGDVNGEVVLRIVPPISNGGSPLTKYRVLIIPTGQIITLDVSSDGDTYLVQDLELGVEYSFQVRSVTNFGLSNNSTVSESIALEPVEIPEPAAPASVQVLMIEPGVVELEIVPGEVEGGEPVTGYLITILPAGETVTVDVKPEGEKYRIDSLTPGETYTFVVSSVGASGTGEAAVESNSIEVPVQFAAPEELIEPTPEPTQEPTPELAPEPAETPVPTVEPVTPTEETVIQEIDLDEGWNLVAFNIDPKSKDILSIVDGIGDALLEIKVVVNGQAIWLYNRTTVSASLDSTLDVNRSYWIKVSESTRFTVTGTELDGPGSIDLGAGLNSIAYHGVTSAPVKESLAQIYGQIIEVRGFDNEGKSYLPELPPEFNTLAVMVPGTGYLVWVAEPVTIDWQ